MNRSSRHAGPLTGYASRRMTGVIAAGLAAALALSLSSAAVSAGVGDKSIWIEDQKLVEEDRPEQNDQFGYSVAVDGDTLVVGAPYDHKFGAVFDCGSVFIFVLDNGTWTLQQRVYAGDPEYGAAFGYAVDISGETLVVGSPEDDHSGHSNIGSAYVFTRSGTTWSQQQKLISSAPAAFQDFGKAVAIDGDTVVAGDVRRNVGEDWETGSAYVFVRSGTTWSEQAVLIGDDTVEYDWFGLAVDLSGETLVATSQSHDTGGVDNAGAAYVFTRSGTTWSQQARLQTTVLIEDTHFGKKVALDGDTCMVSDGEHVVHAFARSGSVWGAPQELTEWVPGDGFYAASIAVRGDFAVVGVIGAAYAFSRSGGLWLPWYKIVSDDPDAGQFGKSVAIEGDTVFIGAPYTDLSDYYTNTGAAYVFGSAIVVSDLEISNDDFQTTAVPGDPYTATVIAANNAGPDDAVGAVVTEVFPSSLSACNWMCSPSGGATCTAGPVAGDLDDTVDLPVGGAAAYSVSCTVDPSAAGTLATTATITSPMGWDDPVAANNSATDTDTLTPEVDLAVSKSNGTVGVIWSAPTVYTIEVTNPGPSDVLGVSVSDVFPAELGDCTWVCTPTLGASCTASGTGDIVDTADLPAGAVVTYTATCTVVGITGTCSNTATATVPAGTTERDPSDNSAIDVDTIGSPYIFVDGFEDGTTGAWSATVTE